MPLALSACARYSPRCRRTRPHAVEAPPADGPRDGALNDTPPICERYAPHLPRPAGHAFALVRTVRDPPSHPSPNAPFPSMRLMLRRSSSSSLSAAALGAAFLFAALLPAAPVRAQAQDTTDRARQ